MQLLQTEEYEARGLPREAVSRLAAFADLLARSPVNVTAIRDCEGIERLHFLDCLSLLDLPEFHSAGRIIDVGSGGGLPAVVLAIALPRMEVVAAESVAKKCGFIAEAAACLGLTNLQVQCARAEELGRGPERESFDVAVSRALASLAVVAELTVPLVRVGGSLVVMKGPMSDQERTSGDNALAILGAPGLCGKQVWPFAGAENRWLYVASKTRPTPSAYPRRPGVPEKRPLGQARRSRGGAT